MVLSTQQGNTLRGHQERIEALEKAKEDQAKEIQIRKPAPLTTQLKEETASEKTSYRGCWLESRPLSRLDLENAWWSELLKSEK